MFTVPDSDQPGIVLHAAAAESQQLFQHHSNWTQYRSTCEALRHEKYLWMAHAGPYARSQRPDALLAERVEGLVSQEQSAWASTQQDKTSHSQ